MEVVVVSGTENADVERFFSDLKKDEGSKKIVFPEFERIEHPRVLLDRIISETDECVKNNQSIYVLTYSQVVLNGVRFVIMNRDIEGTVYAVREDEETVKATIGQGGRLDVWVPGVLDSLEKELLERWRDK